MKQSKSLLQGMDRAIAKTGLNFKELTPKKINNMSYNELIAIVKETNRPPGGERSVARIVQEAFVSDCHTILEIGTSTGVAAIELARLTRATVYGIDINEESLKEARKRAAICGVADKTIFQRQDATKMRFDDETFDLVVCGNLTSLLLNKEKALQEYVRVLKNGGFLAAIPMYYLKQPPKKLIRDVSRAIKVPIKPLGKKYWLTFFGMNSLNLFFQEDYVFEKLDQALVDNFAKQILSRSHLKALTKESMKALRKKYTAYLQLFRKNLGYMGFSILLYRKDSGLIDPILFTARKGNKNL